MPSSQAKQSASLETALQSSRLTDEARIVYFHLRALGLPHSMTFEGFLSVYTLGLAISWPSDMKGKNVQMEDYSSRSGEKKTNNTRAVKEQKLHHTSSITNTRRFQKDKEINEGGDNNKGKWKETLDIVAQRLVGRKEAARVRASISAAKLNSEADFEDPMKVADVRRESLYRILGAVQKEWDIENGQVMDLDRRKKELESQIEYKRKVILLLSALEKREGIRMKRIGSSGNGEEDTGEGKAGIGDLIKRLRTEAILNSQNFQDAVNGLQQPGLDTILSPFLPKLQRRPELSYKQSANALASLHAYHSRLHTKSSGSVDLNERIENALKTLGIGEIRDTKRKLEAVARRRAERRRKFNIGSVTDLSVSETQLEELKGENEQKKQEVQQQLNRAIALGWVCEGYVDLIATFREQTVPAFEESMAEERKRVEGYVDKMKMAILGQRRKTSGSFSQRAREIIGTEKVEIWEEGLKHSSLKVDIMDLGAEKNLVVGKMDFSDIFQLLERKKQKAEHGYAMAEEIRGLVQGFKKLKYV